MKEFTIHDPEIERKRGSVPIRIVQELDTPYLGSRLIFGELANGKAVVLKFSRIPGSTDREWLGLSIAHANGVKVPEPIARITRGEEPRLGILMERICGKLLAEENSENSERKAARELYKLHNIPMPGFGIISDSTAQFVSAKRHINYWLEKTLPFVQDERETLKLLQKLLNQASPNIFNRQPKFLHRDIQSNNIIQTTNGTIHYIDFEWWQGGDPLDDISTYLYHSIRTNKPTFTVQAFLDSYFEGQEISSKENNNLLFHLLLTAARVVSFCARLNQSKLQEAKVDLHKVENYIKNFPIRSDYALPQSPRGKEN